MAIAILLQLGYHWSDLEKSHEVVGKETKESTNLLMPIVHVNVHENQNINWLFSHQVTVYQDKVKVQCEMRTTVFTTYIMYY
jgi:hypothetical protein